MAESARYRTVARVGEVAEGEGRPFEVEDRTIAVILEGGVYYAIDDHCPHGLRSAADHRRKTALHWHGWKFSLEDGRWLDSPKSRVRIDAYRSGSRGTRSRCKSERRSGPTADRPRGGFDMAGVYDIRAAVADALKFTEAETDQVELTIEMNGEAANLLNTLTERCGSIEIAGA